MEDTHWRRVKAVFQETFDREPADRAAFLEAACASDHELRAAVEQLLRAHGGAGGFLEVPVAPSFDDLASLATARDNELTAITARIGPYRVVSELGRGGMGTVYRAERVEPGFHKTVAIKLVRSGMDSTFVLRRFQNERQILSSLEHPGIARLYDGGTTDEGLPFFVMEYVDGTSLLRYCDEQRLSIADRLRLFRRVCNAVQYAHQNLVVHRDLKPSNILVTAEGHPKLLDFGIAKLLSPAIAGGSVEETTPFDRFMTPQYASPEQVRGEPVTTASDVYSLGAILYELLCGQRPYRITGRGAAEISRAVCEAEPPPPSTLLARGDKRRRQLRGDLDNIALKALRKDPEQRYATAAELGDDLQRHLDGFPVRAQPDRRAYRARKFVRRHRAGVLAAGVAALSLVVGLMLALWQARVAVAERNRATAQFNDTRALANALIFKIHDGVRPLPGSTPVRQMIVSEALTYLERLSRDPMVDDALRLELARGYLRIGEIQGKPSVANLGDRQGALASFGHAVDLLRPLTTMTAPDGAALIELVRVELSIAGTASAAGRQDEARAAATAAVARAESLVRREPNDDAARRLVASAHFQHALLLSGPAALVAWQKAGEVFEALLVDRPEDPDRQRNVALVQKYIGTYYEIEHDLTRALPYYTRALELDERRLAANPSNRTTQFDVAADLSNVAVASWKSGNLTKAAADFERCLELREQLLRSDPKDVLARSRLAVIHSRLAMLYVELNRASAALEHAREAVALGETLAPIDWAHQEGLAKALQSLGMAEKHAGHPAEACRAFRRSAAVLQDLAGKDDLSPHGRRSVSENLGQVRRQLMQCGTVLTAPPK